MAKLAYVLVFITLVHSGLGLPYPYADINGRFQNVQFGHQNPILKAPTLNVARTEIEEPEQPSQLSLENPCSEFDYDYDGSGVTQLFAFDPISSRCYPITRLGQQGPCKENMKFYQRPDNPGYGFCDCDQNSKVPAVYNPVTDRCHLLFQREFCPPSQWLQLDKNENLKCSTNPCLTPNSTNSQIQSEFTVLIEGKCVRLGTPCEDKPGETIGFFGSLHPTCGTTASFGIANVGGLPILECTKPGTRWSHVTGTCQKIVSYNLSR